MCNRWINRGKIIVNISIRYQPILTTLECWNISHCVKAEYMDVQVQYTNIETKYCYIYYWGLLLILFQLQHLHYLYTVIQHLHWCIFYAIKVYLQNKTKTLPFKDRWWIVFILSGSISSQFGFVVLSSSLENISSLFDEACRVK